MLYHLGTHFFLQELFHHSFSLPYLLLIQIFQDFDFHPHLSDHREQLSSSCKEPFRMDWLCYTPHQDLFCLKVSLFCCLAFEKPFIRIRINPQGCICIFVVFVWFSYYRPLMSWLALWFQKEVDRATCFLNFCLRILKSFVRGYSEGPTEPRCCWVLSKERDTIEKCGFFTGKLGGRIVVFVKAECGEKYLKMNSEALSNSTSIWVPRCLIWFLRKLMY